MAAVLWNHMTAAELRKRAAENAVVLLPVSFDRIASSGAAGHGDAATAEKGERLLCGLARALAEALAEDPWSGARGR
ncbi:hypothetical protein [Streptomyces nymphaeiformis]|uniref:Creatinine amidohydrolase/Fe(II)-dependent formamide hydrolase-like protein n=1 Tax=Streptomyces nymphaeiformis TaxID=2663842 RepID=A0A7W7XA22_9ACTN|nr:hypothetical protein [Streptomyces nymphaeiformis]MBB4981049.1 creatinine amidohydrolase/Fe(II)-dependent formamide hydrolase-like protein [Streptomyces nymphaeiformis]